MSVISSRKSINSSILKSASRNELIKKTKILRFEVKLEAVKVREVLKEIEINANAKSYHNLIYKLCDPELKVSRIFSEVATYVAIQG